MTSATTTALPGQIEATPRVTRVMPVAALRQASIMALRGLINFRRSPQLLYDIFLWPIAGPVLFANLFGIALKGSVHAYLPLMIPGVLAQIVLTASVASGVAICEDIHTGVFDRFVSMPISRLAPVAGALTAGVIRYVVAATLVITVGYVMGYRPVHPAGLALAAVLVVCCTFAMSWIFAAVGIIIGKPSAVQGVSVMILMSLTFASNALIPPIAMPTWLRKVTEFNPVSHLVSAVRAAADHGQFTSDTVWSIAGALVITLVFAPLTVRLIRTK